MMNFLLTLLLPIYLVFHFVGPIPIDLGVHEGQLNPCLNSRHCAEKSWNSNNPSIDYAKLVAFINEKPRTIVVQETNYYLHAEASSAFFGFVDDLEIYANTESKIINTRSSSRVGDSDLGVNEMRLAELETVINKN